MDGRDALHFPQAERSGIDDYLPGSDANASSRDRPWVTLTFATSLDSALAIAPGRQTALSGPQSKAMTHYLRSRHDAILVGVGTAVADNPSLNCRLDGVGGYGGQGLRGQPRPVVIDPGCRWKVEESKILGLASDGRGQAPWIVCSSAAPAARRQALEDAGGSYIELPSTVAGQRGVLDWTQILRLLRNHGIQSVMIEGGGTVINDLLSKGRQDLVDSVVVTIAPVWLGHGGVTVSPKRVNMVGEGMLPVARLSNTRWHPLGQDVVLCGNFKA